MSLLASTHPKGHWTSALFKRLIRLLLIILVVACLRYVNAKWWTVPFSDPRANIVVEYLELGIVLAVVCWPRLWWIFGLIILEEATKMFVGSHGMWRPSWDWLFHHCSAGVFGVNSYPVILFPLMTAVGEAIYQWVIRHRRNTSAETKEETRA